MAGRKQTGKLLEGGREDELHSCSGVCRYAGDCYRLCLLVLHDEWWWAIWASLETRWRHVVGSCLGGYPDNSAKHNSANDTSAMPTVRKGQQCEWDKSANVKCAMTKFIILRFRLQCIQAKFSKTLDKRSTLIFLQQIAQNKNWAYPKATTLPRICKVEMQHALLLCYSGKTPIWGHFGVCPMSLYVRTIRCPTFCRSLPIVQSVLTVPCVVALPS